MDRMMAADADDMQDAEELIFLGQETSTHSSPVQQKRKRYTPTACDECKRRKVKCDGRTPCHRCARLPTKCIYTQRGSNSESRQSKEFKKMNEKIAMLQEQITTLISNGASAASATQQQTPWTPVSSSLTKKSSLAQSSSQIESVSDSHMRRKAKAPTHPQYMGPTSSAFSFGLAKSSLQRMGIQSEMDHVDDGLGSHLTTPAKTPAPSNDILTTCDPLLTISLNEATRLIDTYEEETGTIYPFLDIKDIFRSAHEFYNNVNVNQESSISRSLSAENDALSGGSLDILKLVIAIALVIEGLGQSSLSAKLLDSVESGFDSRPCGSSADIPEIQALTLMSILQFHSDEEVLAWRTMGLAARAALEMGLHRRETYFAKFPDHEQRLWANKLFWCIFVLDRRWSFGTGLPFALHERDIDPELPEPNDTSPYLLKTMIAYGHIGSKVWKATSNSGNSVSQFNQEKTAYLDFQVREWQKSISPELQLHPDIDDMLEGYSRTRNRLRVLLYLRANQMRLLIYRRTLLTPTTISENPCGAQLVVDVAKDTIRVLDKLNRLSDIYSSQQTCFNYFLVSALAVLFLAICHATAQFNENCREEFFMALDLIRGFSARSYVARKLWKTIKHLKVIGPKLGILPNREQQGNRWNGAQLRDHQSHNNHQSSLANASTSRLVSTSSENMLAARQELDLQYLAAMPLEAEISPAYSYPLDGNQLSYELTTLFEAIEPRYEELPSQPLTHHRGFDLLNYGTAEDLSKSLLDLF